MRASDRAYTALRQDIVEWRLEPGTLLGEVEQSSRLGVSRTPLRDALRQLIADGLAEPHAGRRVVVTDVSQAQIDALFEARVALDTASAALAARRGAPARFLELAESFEQAAPRLSRQNATHPDVEHYYALVSSLDRAVSESAANPYLDRAQVPLKANLARLRRATQERRGRLVESASEHAAIARAVASGDPELAVAATRLHLERARQAISEALTDFHTHTEQNLYPNKASTQRSEGRT